MWLEPWIISVSTHHRAKYYKPPGKYFLMNYRHSSELTLAPCIAYMQGFYAFSSQGITKKPQLYSAFFHNAKHHGITSQWAINTTQKLQASCLSPHFTVFIEPAIPHPVHSVTPANHAHHGPSSMTGTLQTLQARIFKPGLLSEDSKCFNHWKTSSEN